MSNTRTFLVRLKGETEGKEAAAKFAAIDGVISVGLIDEKTEALLRTLQARAASASQQR
jgi:hypothetical protein